MTAPVSVRLAVRHLSGDTGNLSQPAQCVKLTQNADNRPAAAKAAGKSGFDAGKIFRDRKPFLAQCVAKTGGGRKFGERRLRMVENEIGSFPVSYTHLRRIS